jgi:hypothetical protein
MAWTFNPFSGTFDQKGSGGGAQYIDGEVATYADLPLDGSATLNSAWLVRTASGVWPVTRKQAGIYIRTATGGSNRDSDYTYAGTMPDVFSDSQFLLYDNTDTSKNLAFDLGSISTATTRTLTAPNASGVIVLGNDSRIATIGSATINTAQTGGGSGTAGNINTSTAGDGVGGYINTSAINADGGYIDTHGENSTAGGNINTSNGGGSIDTRGTGSIGLGVSGTRTTLTGTATANRAISLPDASGTIALTSGTTFTTLSVAPAANTTALTSTGYSLTGSNAQSFADLSGTWNTTGTPIALKTNLTITAAGSNSMYADFQAGGYSQFGVARISATSNALWLYNLNSGTNTNGIGANYERGSMGWVSNRFSLIVEAAGTGTARGALIRVGSGQSIILDADTHEFRSAGFTQRLGITSSGVNVFTTLLLFGGTTSSFPAIKRSSTVLQARLANDSDFCPLQGQLRIHQNAVSEMIVATHTLTLFDAAGTAYKVPCVAA